MPGMIVAPQAGAVDVGASVLEQGGNAVDAAVTTAVAQAVTPPRRPPGRWRVRSSRP